MTGDIKLVYLGVVDNMNDRHDSAFLKKPSLKNSQEFVQPFVCEDFNFIADWTRVYLRI